MTSPLVGIFKSRQSRILLTVVIMFFIGCEAPPATAKTSAGKKTVVLVSIDGFRVSDLSSLDTPNLYRLANRSGVGLMNIKGDYPGERRQNYEAIGMGRVAGIFNRTADHRLKNGPSLGEQL